MNSKSSIRRGLRALTLCALMPLAAPTHAAEPITPAGPPSRAEFQKLQTEVKEQRSLIIQLMQSDQQRYDMLLRLLQGGASAAVPMPAAPEAAAAAAGGEAPEAASSGGGSSRRGHSAEPRLGTIEGKVAMAGGGELDDVYVYVDGLRGPPARGKTLEIKQEDRQFSPRHAVVQAGTVATFPNLDSVFHNVFSNSPHNSFDLGTYRAGEKSKSVTLTSPGVVDVFCNMHQRMSASILVLPNNMYAKVKSDGTFKIEGVPQGTRKVVAWSPKAKPASQKVELSSSSASVSFSLQHADPHAHLNKLGQAYGSYKD
jgi:plastocyanin